MTPWLQTRSSSFAMYSDPAALPSSPKCPTLSHTDQAPAMMVSFCLPPEIIGDFLILWIEKQTSGRRAGEWRGGAWNSAWESDSSPESLLFQG